MDLSLTLIIFLHNYIAGFVMPWLGLLLINVLPDIKKLGIVAFYYAALGTLFRYFAGLPYDISFLLQIVALLIIITIFFRINLFKSLIASFLGIMVLFSGEYLSSTIIFSTLGLPKPTSYLSLLILPIPQITLTLIIIYLCNHYSFHLFDFSNNPEISSTWENKRLKIITSLISILAFVIIVQLLFTLEVLNDQLNFFYSLSPGVFGIFSTIILLCGTVAILFLVKQLLDLTEKESKYLAQEEYIATLDELYTAIRSERHDIVNHLQTIYGFNQLGYTQEVNKYLAELLGGDILNDSFKITATPGLTALFFIKSGIAKANEIKFEVNVTSRINNLKISAYELNNIVGNLVNNAFDAVLPLDPEKRLVKVYIGADGYHFIVRVSNYGQVNENLKQKLMRKGFTTKKDNHLGLGLHICSSIAQKYGGNIKIENTDNHMVEFSVLFPTNIAKEESYATTSSKIIPFSS